MQADDDAIIVYMDESYCNTNHLSFLYPFDESRGMVRKRREIFSTVLVRNSKTLPTMLRDSAGRWRMRRYSASPGPGSV